ncbi:MAG: GatB/YqeY domain-containing protein [Gilvibacter sp.]
MSLQSQIMDAMKAAMKSKDSRALEALRAIKSEILLAQSASGASEGLSDKEEIAILSKLVKQRKDSAAIFTEQGREDLATPELEQVAVISQFLPEQLSEEEIAAKIDAIIAQTGANSMKDMGKVMGMANGQMAGKADGKTIAMLVKAKLSN